MTYFGHQSDAPPEILDLGQLLPTPPTTYYSTKLKSSSPTPLILLTAAASLDSEPDTSHKVPAPNCFNLKTNLRRESWDAFDFWSKNFRWNSVFYLLRY